jgi:hypothetical protein
MLKTLKIFAMLLYTSMASETLQPFLQDMLKTDATGNALLTAYDTHYDALPPAQQLEEKKSYPQHIYLALLEHRSKK